MEKNREQPEISIIVPIYNAEKYLEECLDSIRMQTYDDFEVIMVNDGSSDMSEIICKRFQNADARFFAIDQVNQGVCVARNQGVKLSKGRFISFIDADDIIDADFLETMRAKLLETESDIVCCDFYNENGKELKLDTVQVLEGNDIFEAFLNGKILNRIMNKLYRREAIETIVFPEERPILEDAYWTAKVLDNVHRVVLLPDAKYYYRFVEGSLSHRKYSETEKAIIHRNKLERFSIIAKHYSDGRNKTLLQKSVADYLDIIFIVDNDITLMGLHEWMKKILSYPVFEDAEDEVFNYIKSIDDPNELHNKYLKRMILSTRTSLKTKAYSLYRILAKRNKQRK